MIVENTGNVSTWILAVPNTMFLGAFENATIDYEFIAPENAPHGTYNGTSRIVIKRRII